MIEGLTLAAAVGAFICAGLQVMTGRIMLRFEGDEYASIRGVARPMFATAGCLILLSAIELARYWALP